MIRRVTYPGPTSPVLRQADAIEDRAVRLGELHYRSTLAVLVGAGWVAGACAWLLPQLPVGYFLTLAAGGGAGVAICSTAHESRRARRRALRRGAALRGFAGRQFDFSVLHGRRGPAATSSGKDARAICTEDDRRRRDRIVPAAA